MLSLTSEAGQVGMAAGFMSVLAYSWKSNTAQRQRNTMQCVDLHDHRLLCNTLQQSLLLPQVGFFFCVFVFVCVCVFFFVCVCVCFFIFRFF